MKSKAGKIPQSRHPLVSALIGLLIAVPFIVLTQLVQPWGKSLFGGTWYLLSQLVFFVFLGWFVKLLAWRRFPTDYHIEAMTPEEFAGATPEAVQWQKQRAKQRAPLPEATPISEAKTDKADKPELALDFEQLERRSAELEALGFVVIKEGAIRTGSHSVPIYERSMSHPDGCFADLNQIFLPAVQHPLTVSLTTRFPERWSITDSTMAANLLLWIVRRKQGVSKRHQPEISLAVMWQRHREHCAYLSQVLKQPALRLSHDEYIRAGVADLREMRPLVLKRSFVLGIINYLRYGRDGEWWGEVKPPIAVANSD